MSAKQSGSEKELAYLHDLYVAPDWGERFAELIDANVKLPKKGRVLYAACGTGSHALALLGQLSKDATLTGMDESAENLELARAKAAAIKAQVEFRAGQLEALDFEDDAFDLVIADASLVATERLPEILAELVRVAAPHGMVALCLVTASSFGEFFSIYWEALISAGLEEHAPAVETLITERYVVADLERDAAREGLEGVQSWTSKEEFAYESGENFLNAPLIKNFLLEDWLASITDEAERQRVTQEIERLIEEERGGADFVLSIKATLLAGRKFD